MRHYRADPTFSTNLIIYLSRKIHFLLHHRQQGQGQLWGWKLISSSFGANQVWLKSTLAQFEIGKNKYGKNQNWQNSIWHQLNLAQIKYHTNGLSVKFNTLKVRSFIQRLKYSDFLITLIHDPDRDDPAEEGDGSILDGHVGGLARLADL